MNGKSKHAQISLEIAAYIFLNSYLASPSVTGFLHAHQWAGDLVIALWSTYRIVQTYSGQVQPAQPPALPEQEQK